MPSLRPVWAMLISFHSANSIEHIGRCFRAAGLFAAHDAGEQLHTVRIGDDANAVVERVGLAVEREQRLAGATAAHC